MNIFEILGPVMVGPSSSHTAGAVRIGLMTRKLLAERPVKASIGMYGSFDATGRGMEQTARWWPGFWECIRMICGFRKALPMPGKPD